VVVLNKEWRLSVPEAAFNSSSSDTTFLFPSAKTRRTETYFYSYKILVMHIITCCSVHDIYGTVFVFFTRLQNKDTKFSRIFSSSEDHHFNTARAL
jgi:hypothetical protein